MTHEKVSRRSEYFRQHSEDNPSDVELNNIKGEQRKKKIKC